MSAARGGAAVQVAVCGPRGCTDEERRSAFAVGELLARRGAVVICGGYTGVMAAVAAGVRAGGGTCVGVLSGPDRTGACPDLTITICTNLGEARNSVIVRSADAVIAVGCSWGTLSEIAMAMRRGGIPVVALSGWTLLDQKGLPVPGIRRAASAAEAVALALGPS